MSNKNYKFLPKNLLVIFLIGAFTVVVVFGLYFYKFHSPLSSIVNDDWGTLLSSIDDDWGTFGDFVGGTLNPLLSFLGLLALLFTVAMQRDELERTHDVLDKQLAAQLDQLANAKKISDEQLKTQAKQQFESTFFALLNVHNQAFAEFSKKPIPKTDKFEEITKTIDEKWQDYYNKSNLERMFVFVYYDHADTPVCSLEIAKKNLKLDIIYSGHYFHVLYEVLKFIRTNTPAENSTKTYSNIVRALLPDFVLQLLAIHCFDNDDYKSLVEEYALFEHASFHPQISDDVFPVILDALPFYDKKAFGL